MPTHLDNEQSIVAAAQAGDSDAFVTLLNQYSRHIYRLGLSITGNHQDAEDVLQESLLKADRAIAEFQGELALLHLAGAHSGERGLGQAKQARLVGKVIA
jgi:Sigma-70 region 2